MSQPDVRLGDPPPPADPQVKPALSGMAIVIIATGLVLFTAGRYRSRVRDVLRALIRGENVPRFTLYTANGLPIPAYLSQQVSAAQGAAVGAAGAGMIAGAASVVAGAPPGGTATGQRVAQTGLGYLGVPYKWAGEDPSGWDCSGFVTYVLTLNGIKLPSNYHTTSGVFYVWTGAVTVPRNECAPGDLLCWASHVALAVDNNTMVHAPAPGTVTKTEKIWNVPAPIVRRPKAYR